MGCREFIWSQMEREEDSNWFTVSGTGVMYINNVGSITQALLAHGNPDFDTALSSQWQATQVSLISVANCVGRIALGSVADFGKHHWGWHRSYWMSVISIILLLSQIFVFAVEDVTGLWKASTTLGFAYGGMFGLFPTIMIENFGIGECDHVPASDITHTHLSFQKIISRKTGASFACLQLLLGISSASRSVAISMHMLPTPPTFTTNWTLSLGEGSRLPTLDTNASKVEYAT
jgi:hypothetical protein